MLRRRTLTSPRLRKKRRVVLIRRIILGGTLAISLLLGARELLHSDFFRIKSIEVIGSEKISSDQIKSAVISMISKGESWFFPQNNFLFINTVNINDSLQKIFPDFSRVRTTLAGVGNLVVEVSEREAYAKWCEIGRENCLVIDSQGFAFDENIKQANTTLTIKTVSRPVLANEIFSQDKFFGIKKIVDHFNRSGFGILSITENGNDYFIKTINNLEIRIASGDNLESTIIKLISIESDLNKSKDQSSIDYIDLRYGNKVFIKRR